MTIKGKLTNDQHAAQGNKRTDNGEIEHKVDKTTNSRKKDNVKSEP